MLMMLAINVLCEKLVSLWIRFSSRFVFQSYSVVLLRFDGETYTCLLMSSNSVSSGFGRFCPGVRS